MFVFCLFCVGSSLVFVFFLFDFVIWEGVFVFDDFFELVDDDGGELGYGLFFKLGVYFEVDQWVFYEGEELVGEGYVGEDEVQLFYYVGQFDEEVGGFVED